MKQLRPARERDDTHAPLAVVELETIQGEGAVHDQLMLALRKFDEVSHFN